MQITRIEFIPREGDPIELAGIFDFLETVSQVLRAAADEYSVYDPMHMSPILKCLASIYLLIDDEPGVFEHLECPDMDPDTHFTIRLTVS